MIEQTITIEITGQDEVDLDMAIDEAIKLIKQGFTSGSEENETGSYSFTVVEK